MSSNVAIVINESDFPTSYSKRTVWLDEFQTMSLKAESKSANETLFAGISACGPHHKIGDMPLFSFPELSLLPYDDPQLNVDLDGYLDAILLAVMRGIALGNKATLVRIEIGRPSNGDTSMAEIRIKFTGSLNVGELKTDSVYSIKASKAGDKYQVRAVRTGM